MLYFTVSSTYPFLKNIQYRQHFIRTQESQSCKSIKIQMKALVLLCEKITDTGLLTLEKLIQVKINIHVS